MTGDRLSAADSRPDDLTHYMQAAGRFRDVRVLVNEANDRVRHPIDLNYVAIPKDTWERIVGLVNRV